MNKLILGLFFALIASLFVQLPVFESADGANTLNLYHLLLGVTFLATWQIRRTVVLTPEVLFFLVLTTTSVLGWSVYGFSTRGVLLPIAIVAFLLGNRWYRSTTTEQRRKMYIGVFAVAVTAVIVRNLLYFDRLETVYARDRTDTFVFYLASGGRNLEATQLGMLATLLMGTWAFLPALGLAAVTSLLMLSRSGIVAVVLASSFWLAKGPFNRTKLLVGASLTSLLVLFGVATCCGDYEIPIVRRFDLESDRSYAAEGQGRLAIWESAGQVLSQQPLGHGTGNGFSQVNAQIGGHLRENNVHNILVEFALDGGVQSALLFALIIATIIRTPSMIGHPCHRFAVVYGLLGLVEYTGYDAIGWFFIGASQAARLSAESIEALQA